MFTFPLGMASSVPCTSAADGSDEAVECDSYFLIFKRARLFLFRFYCACTRPRRYRRRNALAASADVSLAANLPSAFLSPAHSLLNPTPNSHTRTPSPSALARYSGNAGLNASACVAPTPPPPRAAPPSEGSVARNDVNGCDASPAPQRDRSYNPTSPSEVPTASNSGRCGDQSSPKSAPFDGLRVEGPHERTSGWSSKASDGVERRRSVSGLKAGDGRRETTGEKVLKDRRSPRRRGRVGTGMR